MTRFGKVVDGFLTPRFKETFGGTHRFRILRIVLAAGLLYDGTWKRDAGVARFKPIHIAIYGLCLGVLVGVPTSWDCACRAWFGLSYLKGDSGAITPRIFGWTAMLFSGWLTLFVIYGIYYMSTVEEEGPIFMGIFYPIILIGIAYYVAGNVLAKRQGERGNANQSSGKFGS